MMRVKAPIVILFYDDDLNNETVAKMASTIDRFADRVSMRVLSCDL